MLRRQFLKVLALGAMSATFVRRPFWRSSAQPQLRGPVFAWSSLPLVSTYSGPLFQVRIGDEHVQYVDVYADDTEPPPGAIRVRDVPEEHGITKLYDQSGNAGAPLVAPHGRGPQSR